jgi:toxin YoeB
VRVILFEKTALKDFNEWCEINPNIYNRIIELLKDIQNSPFRRLGKPEPLKHELKGFWSRRINKEHRLVYKITKKEIIVVSCKYHYN